MQYIHVRNLDKYQDGYKDRRHYWAKIYVDMIQSNSESEMLSEIDFARLVKMIVLEACTQKMLPVNELYLTRKGFDFGLQSLSETLKNLSHFIEIVDVTENHDSVTVSLPREEKSRVEKKREEKRESISPSVLKDLWNETCKSLPKVKELSTTRATKCRARLQERPLEQWREVFARVQNSDFLRGNNARGWKATFDWLIDNDHNALKVLEGKYESSKPKTADDVMREVFGA